MLKNKKTVVALVLLITFISLFFVISRSARGGWRFRSTSHGVGGFKNNRTTRKKKDKTCPATKTVNSGTV
mgnify:CR=1 FL=1